MTEKVKVVLTYVGEVDSGEKKGQTYAAFYMHPIPEDRFERRYSLYDYKVVRKGLGYKPVVGYNYEVERPDGKPDSIIPATLKWVGKWENGDDIAGWKIEDEVRQSKRLAAKDSKNDVEFDKMRLSDVRKAYQEMPGMHREHFLAKLVAYLHRRG